MYVILFHPSTTLRGSCYLLHYTGEATNTKNMLASLCNTQTKPAKL